MKITIAGQHIELGSSLQDEVEQRIETIDKQYNVGITSAEVTFARARGNHGFECRIRAHYPNGNLIAEGQTLGDDVRTAFSDGATKIAKQARRLHRSRKDIDHSKLELVEE